MKPFQEDVSSKYGAPMGRFSEPLAGLVHVQRVPLVDGCYDQGGAYWGGPATLWCAWNDDGAAYLRASSREDAKVKFLAKYPDVRFYR